MSGFKHIVTRDDIRSLAVLLIEEHGLYWKDHGASSTAGKIFKQIMRDMGGFIEEAPNREFDNNVVNIYVFDKTCKFALTQLIMNYSGFFVPLSSLPPAEQKAVSDKERNSLGSCLRRALKMYHEFRDEVNNYFGLTL